MSTMTEVRFPELVNIFGAQMPKQKLASRIFQVTRQSKQVKSGNLRIFSVILFFALSCNLKDLICHFSLVFANAASNLRKKVSILIMI